MKTMLPPARPRPQYAKIVGLSPRILKEIERGSGNPTLKNVRKALKPFNLDITVRRGE